MRATILLTSLACAAALASMHSFAQTQENNGLRDPASRFQKVERYVLNVILWSAAAVAWWGAFRVVFEWFPTPNAPDNIYGVWERNVRWLATSAASVLSATFLAIARAAGGQGLASSVLVLRGVVF